MDIFSSQPIEKSARNKHLLLGVCVVLGIGAIVAASIILYGYMRSPTKSDYRQAHKLTVAIIADIAKNNVWLLTKDGIGMNATKKNNGADEIAKSIDVKVASIKQQMNELSDMRAVRRDESLRVAYDSFKSEVDRFYETADIALYTYRQIVPTQVAFRDAYNNAKGDDALQKTVSTAHKNFSALKNIKGTANRNYIKQTIEEFTAIEAMAKTYLEGGEVTAGDMNDAVITLNYQGVAWKEALNSEADGRYLSDVGVGHLELSLFNKALEAER